MGLLLSIAAGIFMVWFNMKAIYTVLTCTIETTGTYIKYNTVKRGRGEITYQPVFRYYINGEEFQGRYLGGMRLPDIQKKFVPGQTYTIYVSNKEPGYFVISRKVPIGCVFGILMGIWFIYMGYVSFT